MSDFFCARISCCLGAIYRLLIIFVSKFVSEPYFLSCFKLEVNYKYRLKIHTNPFRGVSRLENNPVPAHEFRKMLKAEWAELWSSKYDDSVRAEGVSTSDYPELFVDLGEIVYATKDYRPLSFREILGRYFDSETLARIYPDPAVGGWRKFSRTHFPAKQRKRERPKIEIDVGQRQRKGGAGWRNRNRVARKIRENR